MTDKNKPQEIICDIENDRFVYLALAYIDGVLDTDEVNELAELLRGSSQLRDAFVALCIHTRQISELGQCQAKISSAITDIDETAFDKSKSEAQSLHDIDHIWRALAEDEKTAESIEIEKPAEPETTTIHRNLKSPTPRSVSRLSLYTAIVSTAALVMILLYVFYNPRTVVPIVATLTDIVDAEWSYPAGVLSKGSDLRAEPMKLARGYAEITFDDGPVVILQGPAEVKLEDTDRIFLSRGKLSVNVPESAVGFVVQTPNATVVDYGTEFGVDVGEAGTTETHVFEGRVELRAGSELIMHGPSLSLSANDAARADKQGRLEKVELKPYQFARRMPSPYELTIRQSSPKAYWRFDDCSPRKFLDHRYNDKYVGYYYGDIRFDKNGPVLGRDLKATAVVFDGKNSYASISKIIPQNVNTGEYSIVLWVRADAPSSQNIITGSNEDGPEQNHSLQIRMNENGQFEFYVYSEDEEEYTLTSDIPAQTGMWYHIAATIDKAGQMRLFIDGQLAGSSIMQGVPMKNYDFIHIASPSGHEAHWEEHSREAFTGAVAEVAVYNYTLSADQIQRLYSVTK